MHLDAHMWSVSGSFRKSPPQGSALNHYKRLINTCLKASQLSIKKKVGSFSYITYYTCIRFDIVHEWFDESQFFL